MPPSWVALAGSAAAAGAACWYLHRRRGGGDAKSWRTLPNPPTKHPLGMSGDMVNAGPELMTLMEDWSAAVEGGSYVASLPSGLFVAVADRDAIESVQKARPHTFRKNSSHWREYPGLFMAEGDSWRRQRRATVPFFGEQQTTRMVGAFAKTAKSLEEAIAEAASGSVGILRYLNQATLEILFATTMSTRLSLVGDAARDADSPMLALMSTLMEAIARISARPIALSVATLLCDVGMRWLAYALIPGFRDVMRAFDRMDGVGEQLMLDRAAARERGDSPPGGARHGDMLDAIAGLERESWGGIMTIMFVAGSETTAVTTSWTLCHLARSPEVQERARREVVGFLEASGGAERALGPQEFSLSKLPYLEGCILEGLRLHPVVDGPINALKAMEPFEMLGRRFPAGTMLFPLFKVAMQRDMRDRFGWDDLEEFRPERWLSPDGGIDRDKERAIMTFGGGPRVCPGALMAKKQMAVLLCSLLSRFGSIRFDESLSGPGGSLVRQQMHTTITPKNLHLVFGEVAR